MNYATKEWLKQLKALKRLAKKGKWGEIERITQIPEGTLTGQQASMFRVARDAVLAAKDVNQVTELPELIKELFK